MRYLINAYNYLCFRVKSQGMAPNLGELRDRELIFKIADGRL